MVVNCVLVVGHWWMPCLRGRVEDLAGLPRLAIRRRGLFPDRRNESTTLGSPGCRFKGWEGPAREGRPCWCTAGSAPGTVAQQLSAGGVERDQAEVIAKAIHNGLEHGDHVTSDQFRAGLAEVRTEIAEVRTEIANLETRLVRWMVGTVIATAALTVGILRFVGS